MAPILQTYGDLTTGGQIKPHKSTPQTSQELDSWTFTRPAWHSQAACNGYMAQGLNWWFPAVGVPGANSDSTKAKQICATCPVKQQCLDYGMTQTAETGGIWGGLNIKQRKTLKRDGKIVVRPPGPKHGTRHAYETRKCRCQKCVTFHETSTRRIRVRRKRAA